MKNLSYLFFIVIILGSCKKQEDESKFEQKFIVNGYIENGKPAYVTIMLNMPFYAPVNSEELEKNVIRHAKVTVSDGQNSEVLTGYYDNKKVPYFYYKGSSLMGELGKKYYLEIVYGGYTLTSETEIPQDAKLNRIWFTAMPESRQQLNINFDDDENAKNYYKIYTKSQEDEDFIRCFVSNHDDKYFNGRSVNLQLNRGKKSNTQLTWTPHFSSRDTVTVKFATMNKEAFEFWQSYENEIVNASNPLMGSSFALKGNIVGRANGIWCGYGVNYYQIIAPK
ncbi:hypothetical protein D3C87_178310 [compost metagenome]